MRKLLFLFSAVLIITSCDSLKKKSKDKETDETEETTTTKKKKGDDDITDDTKKDDSKKNLVDDDNYSPKGKDDKNEDKTDDKNNDKTDRNDNTDRNDDVTKTKYTNADLKTWNWTSYKVQFKAPSDFTIDENSGSKWDGGNGKLHLSIYPKKGEEIERSQLKSLLRSWARDTKVTYSEDVQTMSNLNGYWGVYIDGKGSNGLPTSILLLVDPDDPSISFYIWLQYQSGYLDTAVDILKSFKPS